MKQLTQIFQALLGMAVLVFTALVASGRLAWRTIRNRWMSYSKWLRRLIATVIILSPVCFTALVAYAFYQEEYGRDYYDERLSDNVSLHSYANNKYRVYNTQTQKYTTPKINWVSAAPENDSLAVYALPGKRGFIDVNTGRIVIDALDNDYRKAWVFSEGLAAVIKGDRIGFINAYNEEVIPFMFDYSEHKTCDFSYQFNGGYCVMTTADGKLGLIDRKGNWTLPPSFDEIWAAEDSGYRVIVKDGKCGVLDSRCIEVYATEYDYVDIVTDGFVLTKDGRKWHVDFDGNIMRSFMFDSTQYLKYPIGYDECGDVAFAFADYLTYEVYNSYGIMNRHTGEPITPAIYSDINMLSKDLFEVRTTDSYDWCLVDTAGKEIPNP